MASLNRWSGIGNLTKDPETRYMPNGDAVTNVSIACNETWKDKNGEKKERVEYVNLTFFRKLAEAVGEHLKKGESIFVEGALRTEKYTDKSGVEKYATKVVVDKMQMLGSKQKSASQGKTAAKSAENSLDDDIPF